MSVRPLPLSAELAGIHLDGGSGLALQLYRALRERILDGRLAQGARLPASRELAKRLGVSRNTVTRTLEQLQAEGFVETRLGAGTFVSAAPRSAEQRPAPPTDAAPPAPGLALPPSGPPRAFRIGVPALDLFPYQTWARLQARFWRRVTPARLGYGDPAGEATLRGMIAAYLRSARGLACAPDQIVVTSGAQQGIALCAQLLARDAEVAVENPGYRAAAAAFSEAGATLRGVAVDAEGMQVQQLDALPDCRLVYLTPSHQYPTGVTLSLPRRLALLDWAQSQGGWIVEDDYDGEYRYSGTPLAPLAALDRQQRVIYVGTFGKTLFPALRLGYLVLPEALVAHFTRRRALDTRHQEIGSQAVMAEFIAAGHFQRHVRRMRKAAQARRAALLAAWPQGIEGLGQPPAVEAGLHLCVPVSDLARERQLVTRARGAGIEINGLEDYWLAGTPADARSAGLVLGFAAVPEAAIGEALATLGRVWRRRSV